jgi:hypothetical protein
LAIATPEITKVFNTTKNQKMLDLGDRYCMLFQISND